MRMAVTGSWYTMKSKPQHIKTGPYSGTNKTIVENTIHFLCGQDIPEALGVF